jgi:hypothetical protein
MYDPRQNESTPSQRLTSPPETEGGFLRLTKRNPTWQHRRMIEFRTLPNEHPAFVHSPRFDQDLRML